MSTNSNPPSAQRSLTVAMIAFTAAFGLHGIDHFRRGMTASPPSVMVGGMIQGFFAVMALVLVLRQHRRAAQAASVVGFGSAALFTYAHVLPTFLPGYQDSFSYGPRVNVTWFSWLTAAGEIGTGLMLGYVGLRTRRRATNRLERQGNSQCCTSKNTSA
jgi:cyanate permease